MSESQNFTQNILIIRFSSFGDIVQCLSAIDHISEKFPQAKIYWAVRSDFADFLKTHPKISEIVQIKREDGFKGLINLFKNLKNIPFTHIYDAHSNLRSHILSFLLKFTNRKAQFIRRSKLRWSRWILLKFKKLTSKMSWPFLGAKSFVTPLDSWGIQWNSQINRQLNVHSTNTDLQSVLTLKDYIVLAPSAAWKMKRWPISNWIELIKLQEKQNFVLIGGSEDQFCEDIKMNFSNQVLNLAGKLSWIDTALLLKNAKFVISGDTGALHLADYLGTQTLGLIGPTAFGFPSFKNSSFLTLNLPCQPCSKDGRGSCKQKIYQQCLVQLPAEWVSKWIFKDSI